MIFESRSYDFILRQMLVVVPLDGFTSSGSVVYNVCSVELVESGRHHRIRIIFDSGQVHEVDSLVCDIVVLSDLVKNLLQGSGMLKHCSVVIY